MFPLTRQQNRCIINDIMDYLILFGNRKVYNEFLIILKQAF